MATEQTQAPAKAAAPEAPKKAETVVVGCKLPNGHILHVGDTKVELKGQNDALTVGGHGLTRVNKEFWDAWMKDHQDYAPVRAGLLFAHTKEMDTKAEAKEKADNLSGFEGVNPKAPGEGVTPATGE